MCIRDRIATECANLGVWQGVFGVQLGVALVALFCLWLLLPKRLSEGYEAAGSEREPEPSGAPLRAVLARPSVLPSLVSVALYSGAFAACTQFLGTWLDSVGVIDKAQQSGLWIGLGVVSALGAGLLTRYADLWGKRAFVILTSAIVGVGFLLLSLLPPAAPLLLVVGIPMAACTAARSGAMTSLVSGLVPAERRGSVMTLRTVAVNLGMGLMVWIGGGIVGEGAVEFRLLAGVAAGAVLVSLLLVVRSVKEAYA